MPDGHEEGLGELMWDLEKTARLNSTVCKEEVGKEGRVFRIMSKGHMDKTKGWVGPRVGSGDGWGGWEWLAGAGGGGMETPT